MFIVFSTYMSVVKFIKNSSLGGSCVSVNLSIEPMYSYWHTLILINSSFDKYLDVSRKCSYF